ncbi:MAG: aminoglycoside phosphotransferase family protein [Fimbriimonas sp.]|nr:aminoglycoside phosphotransferase family protein [Fimbriimonas sp.]
MDSLTKPTVSQVQLEAICREYLGSKLQSAVELKDGWFNAAFLLTDVYGQEAVLKIAPLDTTRVLRYEKALMHAEVTSMRMVRERTTVPVPEILSYDTTRGMADSDLFLAEKLPGMPLDRARPLMTQDAQDAVDLQVGVHLRMLHSLHGCGHGVFNEPAHATWRDAFLTMMDWLGHDASDMNVELPEGVFEAGDHLLWALDEAKTPSFLHWDMWDGNIFVDPQKATVTGYIDFERCMWGDPIIEANYAGPRPAFLKGYASDILSRPGARESRLLYDLYLHLILVIESHFRGYPLEHEAWGRGKLYETLQAIQTGC